MPKNRNFMKKMKLKDLTKKNLIELATLRFKQEKINYSRIVVKDATFKYFNGVAFIIKSDIYADEVYAFHFDKFYPNEFMFLLELGVHFN